MDENLSSKLDDGLEGKPDDLAEDEELESYVGGHLFGRTYRSYAEYKQYVPTFSKQEDDQEAERNFI